MSKKVPCFKLVILGGEGSGKTSLLKAYQGGKLNFKEKRSE